MAQIIQRDLFEFHSTSIALGASTSSVVSAYQSKAGLAVDVGLDLLRFNTKSFFLKNQGPNIVASAQLESTNIPAEQRNANDWEIIDSSTFAPLAAGAVKSLNINDGRRYWRMRASSTQPTVVIAGVAAR